MTESGARSQSVSDDQIDISNNIFLCIKQFNARLGDELSLKVGDKIEVLADDSEYNDGWYMGRNITTGSVGLYPKTFTQVLQSQKQQPLRSRSRRMNSNANLSNNSQHNSSNNIHNNNNNNSNSNNTNINTSTTNSNDSVYSSNNLNGSIQSLSINDNIKTSTPNTTLTENNQSSNSNSNPNSNGNANQFQFHTQIKNANQVDKHSSVHKTMSDIDRALQELRGEGLSILNEDMAKDGPNHRLSYLDLDPLNVKEWTPEQVSSYFAYLGFDMESSGQFARHKITGTILLELELAYLKELDITSFGTRFEMFKEIEALRVASQNHEKLKKSSKRATGGLSKIDTSTTQNVSLMPAISVQRQQEERNLDPKSNYQKTYSSHKQHQRTRSQSFDDLAETHPYLSTAVSPLVKQETSIATRESPYSNNQRYQSHNYLDTQPAQTNAKKDSRHKRHSSYLSSPTMSPPIIQSNSFQTSFESPRRAPAKPNHPSPIANNFKFGGDNNNGNTLSVVKSRPASSIYYDHSSNNHRRQPSDLSMNEQQKHRRHSSVFSFLSNGNDTKAKAAPSTPSTVTKAYAYGTPSRGVSVLMNGDHDDLLSPSKGEISSPTRRSVSVKTSDEMKDKEKEKRSASDTFRFKSLRTASSQNLKSLTNRAGGGKTKTSAFQEGIQDVSPEESTKNSDYSGWMSKKGNSTISNWKSRYFTLHATRLSYFTSMKDKRERGLIDITAHRVLAAKESEDKFAALYAASTGSGRYCFKLVPPAPGYKKGLTFTQPKTHYFAVDTQEEMRGWMAALMKATIDVDDTVPVVSSCVTPTVTLAKAQEMLSKAREETRLKDEELRARGYMRPGEQQGNGHAPDANSQSTDYSKFDGSASSSLSPTEESSSLLSNNSHPLRISTTHLNNTSNTNARASHSSTPYYSNNNRTSKSTATTTPIVGPGEGFSSPYLLASGLLSPTSPRSPKSPSIDYFEQTISSLNDEIPLKSNSKSRRKKSNMDLNENTSDLKEKKENGFKQSIRRKSSLNFLNKKFDI